MHVSHTRGQRMSTDSNLRQYFWFVAAALSVSVPVTASADEDLLSGLQRDNAAAQQSDFGSVFDGVVSIDGRQLRTNNRKEFERLGRQMKRRRVGLARPRKSPTVQPDFVGNEVFEGVVTVNGKETRLKSREEFERLRQQIDLPGLDLMLPGDIQQANAFEGVLNINGRKFRAANPEEMRRLQRRFGVTLPRMNAPGGQQDFEGMINDNGQVQRFDDPAAFQKAQQQLLNVIKQNLN